MMTFKELICFVFGHKIVSTTLREWGITGNNVKCTRCGKQFGGYK